MVSIFCLSLMTVSGQETNSVQNSYFPPIRQTAAFKAAYGKTACRLPARMRSSRALLRVTRRTIDGTNSTSQSESVFKALVIWAKH